MKITNIHSSSGKWTTKTIAGTNLTAQTEIYSHHGEGGKAHIYLNS